VTTRHDDTPTVGKGDMAKRKAIPKDDDFDFERFL
jgi:hypothetical protein